MNRDCASTLKKFQLIWHIFEFTFKKNLYYYCSVSNNKILAKNKTDPDTTVQAMELINLQIEFPLQ